MINKPNTQPDCPNFYVSGVDKEGHPIISKTYGNVPDDIPTYEELRAEILSKR